MNYYIIPKNNFNIKLSLQLTDNKIEPCISFSLNCHTTDIYNQLLKLQESNNSTDIEYITKIVNPFEFINSNVPGSLISVSKVKADSIIFFELMELFEVFNINEILSLKNKINVCHLTHNYKSTNYLLNMLREENEDNIILENFNFNHLYKQFIQKDYKNKLDLIIFEFYPDEYIDTKKYIHNMVLVLLIITKYQMNHGTSVIKINNILYKAVIDVIFILSGIYDKIFLVKPSISNITNGDRYLICKGFNENLLNQSKLVSNIDEKIILKMSNNELMCNSCITSIIENELPYYLLNKIEESNLVIGRQQLEAYDQIINIFKNKNREEKVENLKRIHIQKCIQWCEKNQLPHNKFTDNVNIFLTLKKRPIDECKIDS
jgi:hypothetical protein